MKPVSLNESCFIFQEKGYQMPKVTPEYTENKKKMIVDAAYHVCLRKPAEMVTISDVIAETGLSQGAIYRYYNGLDDIFADMVSRMRTEYDIITPMEELIKNDYSFEEITFKIFDILAEAMKAHLLDVQKINFDLGVIAINEPERAAKIMSGIKTPGNMDYLKKSVPGIISAAAKNGYDMKVTPEELALYISSSYTGIEKFCILNACYRNEGPQTEADPKVLFRTLAKSIILLLGGSIND